MKKKMLVLENGKVFNGYSFGSEKNQIAEIVCNTSMVGYQEILSDPANCNKIVVMTYPLIGNYGLTDDDYESKNIYMTGMVVRENNDNPSNFRFTQTLSEVMDDSNVSGIYGLDTRELSKMIRDEGSMKAMIVDGDKSVEECLDEIKKYEIEKNLIEKVSTKKIWFSKTRNPEFNVIVVDNGLCLSTVTKLKNLGCNVCVVPYDTSAEEILKRKPNGMVISTGAGNPEEATKVVELVKQMKGVTPMLGLGIGCEIIALACGAKVEKMKFGHHGSNHGCKMTATGKIEFNSQNHCYSIVENSLEGTGLAILCKNILDDEIEGVEDKFNKIIATEYYPESDANPAGSVSVFEKFKNYMKISGGENYAEEK